MEKTEAAEKLKKAGYQVQFDSSVVTVILPSKVNRNQEIKKLRTFLDQIGYDASFGIKQNREKELKNDNGLQEEEDLQQDEIKQEISEEDPEIFSKEEEVVEIGEQFSLEDFGIN